jgi:choline-sulfatase
MEQKEPNLRARSILRINRWIRCRLMVSLFGLAVLLELTGCHAKQTGQQSPFPKRNTPPVNVILVTIDTVRADHVHSYGYENIATPIMDKLSSEGTLFESAVAQVPLTTPSHACILTGTYPYKNGVRDVGPFTLKSTSVTLATLLKSHGWATGAFVGSSVLKKVYGFNQGFDFYDDKMASTVESSIESEESTRPAAQVVDSGIRWLDSLSSGPFLAWLHFYDAHQPYRPTAAYAKLYPGRPYDAEIAYTDEELGRFLEAVRAKRPDQKTIVVVMSDHGEGLGDHGEQRHGIFLYDSTIRIPLIILGPGVPAGVRVAQQARTIDVLPTILDLLAIPIPVEVQGVSLVPTFTGKNVASAYSYEETLYPKIQMGWSELRGLRTLDWKYIRAPKPELYDLHSDPSEKSNVIASHPDVFREFERQMKALLGPSGGFDERVAINPMNDQNMRELKSLGYLSGAPDSTVEANGQGADPKDRVSILKVMEDCMGPSSPSLNGARRISMLRQALHDDPTNKSLYYGLGDQYERAGQYDLAKHVYIDAVHNGIRSGSLLARLGDLALRDGQQSDAIKYYEQSAQLNPFNYQSQTNLGMAYLNTGQEDAAEKAFRWVLSIEEYAPAYNGLGLIDAKRGHFDQAVQDFQHATALDPSMAEPELNLGLAYKAIGDTAHARQSFELFLKNASPHKYGPTIAEVKAELANSR